MTSRTRIAWIVALLAMVAIAACASRLDRRLIDPRQGGTLDGKSRFLKAHLRNGSVYVLSEWQVEPGSPLVRGRGELLDANRKVVSTGTFVVQRDSIALFETNVLRASNASIALTVMSGITAAITIGCIAAPKACFGSCPTFYAADSTGRFTVQAESFSASIAPSLEANDVDMLNARAAADGSFTLRLTNEALETHVIRKADLLVVPRAANQHIFITNGGTFYATDTLQRPSTCRAGALDCASALAARDGVERWTVADSFDLAAKETIELEFDGLSRGPLGIVITARQTLMTTFLVYQWLAYMGHEAGRYLAGLGSADQATIDRALAMSRLLGRIEVRLQDAAGAWTLAGVVGETGPIATDTKLVPLREFAAPLRVQLRMTKGLWRIDRVALTTIIHPVEAVRLAPQQVRSGGRPVPAALIALRDSVSPLVTWPGESYELHYRLPRRIGEHQLFLDARGYYLEWMRSEWMREQNWQLAAAMVLDPAGSLKRLAPIYKQLEPTMEQSFWNSRYVPR